MPTSPRNARTSAAASRTISNVTPGDGSRSMRSSSMCSGVAARYGHGWKPRHALVGRPQHVGQVGHHDRPRLGAVDRGHGRGDEPVGRAVGDPLLEERLARRRRWGSAAAASGGRDRPHQRLADGDVVAGEVELGLAVLGEHHLVRAGDRDGATGDLDVDRGAVVVLGHHRRRYTPHRDDRVAYGDGPCPERSSPERGRRAPAAPTPRADPDVTAQLRLAISMRGGVSLAVWIGGALAEIDVLRRSRPSTGVSASDDPNAPIYGRLSTWPATRRSRST